MKKQQEMIKQSNNDLPNTSNSQTSKQLGINFNTNENINTNTDTDLYKYNKKGSDK